MSNEIARKIMIVDDEETSLFFLGKILERAGYIVVSTSKGKEAPSLAVKEKPDLIILDIVMPDMNGSEVAALLGKMPETQNTPIIYLSAILTKAEENLIQKSGKHFVLAKPVTGPELTAKVSQVFAAKQ